MMVKKFIVAILFLPFFAVGQNPHSEVKNDSNTPLHLLKPDYNIPYGVPDSSFIVVQLKEILALLEKETPVALINTKDNSPVTIYSDITASTLFAKGAFRLNSYEWGVTYAAMLNAGEVTGLGEFTRYTSSRLAFLASVAPYFRKASEKDQLAEPQMEHMLHPAALDDAGAMCMAFIRNNLLEHNTEADPIIENDIQYILTKQYRLSDGTLARNRPQANTLWLDDMFMGIPALVWMGKYTGDTKYYDEAVKQVHQFSQRMFVVEKGLFIHGWVEEMEPRPTFFWGRANGWAVMALVEVLKNLPEGYPGYAEVMQLMKSHLAGLVKLQSPDGFWHQLLDHNETYPETSATAIYTYCLATAINRGWVDAKAYGPAALLGWNAVSTKITSEGYVQGTCVGTGMGFDPAFYAYRPVSQFAAHGYGPAVLAGSEIIRLLRLTHPRMNDSAVQFYSEKAGTSLPIFEVGQK